MATTVKPLRTGAGNVAVNQYVIWDSRNERRFFQSYDVIVCVQYKGETLLDENYWDYSRTTMRYLSQFLGHYTDETRKKIKEGKYKLANLNSDMSW